MTSRIAKRTVIAIVLLVGASPIHAEDAAATPGSSPFSEASGFGTNANYSGYIGDDSELIEPPDAVSAMPQAASYAAPVAAWQDGFMDAGKKGGKAAPGKGKGGYADQPWVYSPWVSVEYMHTWLEGRQLPPLVTTSTQAIEGVLPAADILFGGEDVSGGLQAAGKLSFGAWFDPNERLGAVGKFFSVQTETVPFDRASDSSGVPLLARPFYETDPFAGVGPASFLVSGQTSVGQLPFTLDGDIHAATHTDVLGAEGYLRYLLYCAPGRRLDLIGGYQFSRVDDTLQIDHRTNFTPQIFGARLTAEDLFETQNKFHGGTLGLMGEIGQGPIVLSVLGKVGLGNMNEVVTIAGRSALTDAGGFTSHFNSGILALPTNMGTYKQDKFAFIPEAEVKLTFKLTKNLEASVGYDFIYWSSLALAGEQIETAADGSPLVNSSQWFGNLLNPAGGSHPSLTEIKDSSLWLQGLSVGLNFRM